MISNPASRIGLLRPTSSVAVPSAGSPPDTHTQTLSSCCVYVFVFVFVCMYVSVCVCGIGWREKTCRSIEMIWQSI